VPIYAFACACGEKKEVFRQMKDYKRAPKHCGKPMQREITGTHYVWNVFPEYRAIGRGRPVIKTRQEHKDYLRQNNYEEVGNDSSMAPPELHMSDAEVAYRTEQKRKEELASFAIIDQAPPL
jgi:hypothetical protein